MEGAQAQSGEGIQRPSHDGLRPRRPFQSAERPRGSRGASHLGALWRNRHGGIGISEPGLRFGNVSGKRPQGRARHVDVGPGLGR